MAMRARKTPLFKRLLGEKSGNAVLFTALGMPVLIGAAGYAMDMAQMYSWKRELQHSVDQAALAGAWTLAYDKNSQNWSARALQEYDANQVMMAGHDAAGPTIQLGSYGGLTNNSVIVSARVTKRLPFSGFLVNKAMTVFARAQATYAEGGTYQACLMALKKNEAGTFVVGGTATVNASCGLGALSCATGAIDIGSNTNVTANTIVTCGTANVQGSPKKADGTATAISEGATGISNPFETLPPPTPDSEAAKTFSCKTKKNELGEDEVIDNEGAYHVYPGRYTGGVNLKCKVVLNSGIYVIDGGVLDLTDNKSHVTGNGVMFLLRNGAQVKIGGSGNGGYVNLSPMEAADFVGTPNEPYKNLYGGMLIYEDKTGQTTPVDHVFNGNSDVTVRGTLYLPNGDLTINGGGNVNPMCFQLWASTLKINGNASLTTTCTSTQTNSAGSSAGGVRLVA
jgi:Flp pilus assembly protein TadG